MKNDMQIGRSYEFIDIPVNHYFFASGIIFQSRRSGDVMHSLSPDTLVMHVYSSVNNERYSDGDIVVDYFGEGKFVYLGDSREFVNKLIEEMKKEIANAEKNPGAE